MVKEEGGETEETREKRNESERKVEEL